MHEKPGQIDRALPQFMRSSLLARNVWVRSDLRWAEDFGFSCWCSLSEFFLKAHSLFRSEAELERGRWLFLAASQGERKQ
jgi:hypothetical protein